MVAAPRIGVLALQGDVREHRSALQDSRAEVIEVRRPAELADLDGLVLPGGESTTMGKLAAAFGLLEPLRAAIAGGLPVYGSCAGLVLLAREVVGGSPDQPLLGGLDVVVRRNAFGRQVDSFEAEVEFHEIDGGPVAGVFIRAPWVESAGTGVQVLAEHAGKIVAVRQGDVLATSFHPELTGDRRVHGLFCDIVRRRS